MFERTKHFLGPQNRGKIAVSVLIVIVLVALTDKITLRHDPLQFEHSLLSTLNIPEFCLVTHEVEMARAHRNTLHVSPAKEVVPELYEYVTYNEHHCPKRKEEGERLVVAIVSSSRNHFQDRNTIRQTWASIQKYKHWHVRTVFLVGQSNYCLNVTADKDEEDKISTEEKMLKEESQRYGDVLIGAFADTYRNLTYKHLMGYKYVLEHCSEVDFLIKTDDDIFVEIPAILDYRSNELKRNSSEKVAGDESEKIYDMYCHWIHVTPSRDPTWKWMVTREEWPEDTFQPECIGTGFAMSAEWLKYLYSVRHDGGFLWIDDQFILGELREIAEKKYGKEAHQFGINYHGLTTDKRGDENYIKENCQKTNDMIGWFVTLNRGETFVPFMECLWKRAQQKSKVRAIIVSKHFQNVTTEIST